MGKIWLGNELKPEGCWYQILNAIVPLSKVQQQFPGRPVWQPRAPLQKNLCVYVCLSVGLKAEVKFWLQLTNKVIFIFVETIVVVVLQKPNKSMLFPRRGDLAFRVSV